MDHHQDHPASRPLGEVLAEAREVDRTAPAVPSTALPSTALPSRALPWPALRWPALRGHVGIDQCGNKSGGYFCFGNVVLAKRTPRTVIELGNGNQTKAGVSPSETE